MTQAIERTNTLQEYFAHVGNLESQGAIALIAQQMLNHPQHGLNVPVLRKGNKNCSAAFKPF